MKVVVAMDSFKGSLTSLEAGNAVKEGISSVASCQVAVKALADGGEGTTEAFVEGYGGEKIRVTVEGPYGRPVEATYGWLPEKNLAIMEMAAASGILLAEKSEMNPLKASTYGFGEMILDAMGRGARHFILGIGGSATNDGGLGMLTALGYQFLKEDGTPAGKVGESLQEISSVSFGTVHPLVSACTFQVACDVNNPLLGERGATAVYGPQKGVTEETGELLEKGLLNFSEVTASALSVDHREAPGAGAAGGLGFALLSYLKAELKEGVKLVLEAVKLEEDVKAADLVITGEGRIDAQSSMGKAPMGVMQLAKKHNKRVIALGGSVTKDISKLNELGMDACFSILSEVVTLEEAMERETAERNLRQTAAQIMRLLV